MSFAQRYRFISVLLLLMVTVCYAQDLTPHLFPATINVSWREAYGPVLSADDKTLYFVGRDNQGSEDIYVSYADANEWTDAQILTSLSTPYNNEAPTSLSVDGSTLFLFSEGRLMLSHRTTQGWGVPTPMPSSLRVSSWQADAMLSSDGQAILFAAYVATKTNTKPTLNIMVSLCDSTGHFGAPSPLASPINTSANERSPFLHPDMHTLYFASDRPGGQGGMDIYVSTRLHEDSWDEWSQPRNVTSINTVGDDCWYKVSTDGQIAYFARKENNRQRLYWTYLPNDMRPQRVLLCQGNVHDQRGFVYTQIRWDNLQNGKTIGRALTDPATGNYSVVLPGGVSYALFVDDERYYPVSVLLDTSYNVCNGDTLCRLYYDIALVSFNEMIYDSVSVPLNNLFFDIDKADILPASYLELNRLAQIVLRKHFRVCISGHTDDTGTTQHNQQLSLARAEAVRQYLINCGCQASSLAAIGYGATRPISTDTTAVARAKNRRVEIQFMK